MLLRVAPGSSAQKGPGTAFNGAVPFYKGGKQEAACSSADAGGNCSDVMTSPQLVLGWPIGSLPRVGEPPGLQLICSNT